MTKPSRVLYVDDNSNSLEVRAMMLGEYGIDVVTETNVEDARGRLAEGDIDCVVSDLDMPDEDGFDLLEYVQDTHPELPFILFTSHESEDVIERALDSGATDYFPKSLTNVSYRLLAHRIEQAIRMAGSEQAPAAGSDTRVDEPKAEAEVSVPQTEIDPANKKHRADVESWGWNSDPVTEEATETPTAVGDANESPITVASDESVETAESMANGSDWKVTSVTNAGLQWLDSDERRIEPDEPSVASGQEPDEGDVEADEFVYPASGETSDRWESTLQRTVDSGGIEIVGTVERESDTEMSDITADTGPDAVTTSTDESTVTVSEPKTASPIPGISPSSISTETPEAIEKPGDHDGTNGKARPTTESGEADSEGGLAAKINLGPDSSPATEPSHESTSSGPEASDPDSQPDQSATDRQPTPGAPVRPEPEPDRVSEIQDESTEAVTESKTETDTGSSTHEHERTLLDGFDPQPGDGVLVECGSQDSRKGHACLDLLGVDDVEGRNVLLIRYRQIGSERLRRIAEDARDVHLISIGYRQSVPNEIDDLVETTRISNPSELTRLGIVMTRVIGNWDTDSVETVVCLDSLDILAGYKDERSVFRFLHVLLSKLQSSNAISHFHIDPSGSDTQGADTLKPLFDSIVTIDDDGVHIE